MSRTGRPATRCRNGVVASPHYLASLAGARMLLDGGNAIDAAVAANAVLTVVYPHNCSIGGDAFWLIALAGEAAPRALNGSGRSAARARLEWFQQQGLATLPRRGILSVSVPGTVASWAEALERCGTLPLKRVLAPAIAYAYDGFPVSPSLATALEAGAELLAENAAAAAVFLPNGRPPRLGEVLRQPDLGRTLEAIARGGPGEFYHGGIARAIAAASRELGGLLEEGDLAEHRSDWVEPISTTYRGLRVFSFPPPTQGVLAIGLLNVLEGFNLATLGQGSAEAIHLMVEAKKLVYRARERYLGDPSHVDVPVARLTSKAYAEELRRRIDPERAQFPVDVLESPGDTISLCAVDRWGNAVSLIQSLYSSFGSGVVVPGTGILLQNRGACFTLTPGHPNCIAPRKRPFHTLIPAMAFQRERPWLVYGTMGGSLQPQVQAQVVTNVVDYGMDVQAALEAPRWSAGGLSHDDCSPVVFLEAPFPERVVAGLERRGHSVERVPAWSEALGHAHAIRLHQDSGVLEAGADPRSDGAAIGW